MSDQDLWDLLEDPAQPKGIAKWFPIPKVDDIAPPPPPCEAAVPPPPCEEEVPPPPSEEEVPPPPREVEVPPSAPDSLPPPAPPSHAIAIRCESCGMELEKPIARSRYCPPCRFSHGNPFKPASVLGIAHAPSLTQYVTVESDLNPVLDGMPFEVELRCLMEPQDTPMWKHDLRHAWPDSGVSLFLQQGFRETLLLKIHALHGENKRSEEENTPYNLTRYCMRMPSESHIPLVVKAKLNVKKNDPGYYFAVVSVRDRRPEEIVAEIKKKQLPAEERNAMDLLRVNAWVNAHRADRCSSEVSCLEPPVLCVQCPISMMRIEIAARGEDCEHLQPFDLKSFIHTMKCTPPQSAWLCPICSRVSLPHKVVLDTYGQQVIKETDEYVLEVLVAKDGRYEISKYEESESESSRSSDDEAVTQMRKRRKTEREQKNAREERERLREAWTKLQEDEKLYGFMSEGQVCSRCEKIVTDQGGLMCGRPLDDGEVRGCGLKYCWRCMNQGRGELGQIRTTKREFLQLDIPWWMHDKCMSRADELAYFEEEDEPAKPGLEPDLMEEEDGPDTFAWE